MLLSFMQRDETQTVSLGPSAPAREASLPALEVGAVVAGRYRIEARLGQGGSAVVYQAFDQHARVWLALKVLQVPDWSGSPAKEALFRELRFGRSLQHPNVCRIYEVFEADGRCFLAMEYASEGTLRAGRPPVDARGTGEKLRDARAVIAGLAAIHRAGLVHRDFKPENILRLEDGRLVVSDFGITRALQQTITTSRLVGTPGYLAPEMLVGAEASQASDVWSLGVVLHEILTAERPRWTGSTWEDALSRRSGDPQEAALAAVCRACLRTEPSRRPPTAAHVERLLASRLRRGQRRGWRLPLLILAAGVVAALVVVLRRPPPARSFAACGGEGQTICTHAGGVCEQWPDLSEHCRWADVPRRRCGLLAEAPLSPPNQGVWTPDGSGGPGACLVAVADLCRLTEWERCRRFGAVTCENYGARYCRWTSDEQTCNRHTDKTCWGIWTAANHGPGRPGNAVPNGQDGACISEFYNLTGAPCP
jgi:hypothetical protein